LRSDWYIAWLVGQKKKITVIAICGATRKYGNSLLGKAGRSTGAVTVHETPGGRGRRAKDASGSTRYRGESIDRAIAPSPA
jgi:hypothetical protein